MTNTTTQTSAAAFIEAMKSYTGDNFYNDVAYDFGINDDATSASDGANDATAIIFDDDSAVWFDQSANEWKERDFNDFVFAFQIVDGVTRSETLYTKVVAGYGHKFVSIDEDALSEICEQFAKSYDKNGDEDFTVCRLDFKFEGNEYDVKDYKFAFDGSNDFEWETSREYVTF